MMRSAALLISAGLLASCGSEEAAPPLQNDIMVRSAAQQQLFDLNDLDRAIALKRAISDQGLRCERIESTGFVTRYKDMDMWTATCGDDRQWALFVGANDSVQVRLCADNEKVGLPACTIQPGTEGGTGLENLSGNSPG
ncbi:MAG: hypothetical protein M3Q19_01470 [Pseudomonadota bacterium]|nr:hypothetical protein [Pseudomonadota bacterium]